MESAGFVHLLHAASQFPGHRRFVRALRDVESVQRAVLVRLLALSAGTDFGRAHDIRRDWNATDVAERLPVTSWADWASWVDRQRATPFRPVLAPGCFRFEPTSGSTATRKWIPYSSAQLAQFDRASAPWLFDLARSHPGILAGKHYWSLSWLPNELRSPVAGAAQTGDDLELLPWWKRFLLGQVMAVTPDVARLHSTTETLFETLVRLSAAGNLSLVSVWSPTFALELLRRLGEERMRVAERLVMLGSGLRSEMLRSWDGIPDGEFFRTFWPRLALVSAWDTGSSAAWARRLASLLPQAAFQGKGVWATEGVVSIPFQGRHPLAVRSHYYEFRCLATGKIIPSWRLEQDMEVQPLLSTGSGFWRYALEDRLRVTGFLHSAPCLQFVARLSGTDLVGEKLSAALAQQVLLAVQQELPVECVALLARAVPAGSAALPHYVLLAGGNPEQSQTAARLAEKHLARIHHYGLARELNQLGPAQALVVPDPLDEYFRRTGDGCAGQGSRKVEPVTLWREWQG